MMKPFTDDALKAMSVQHRAQLWKNACSMDTPQAGELSARIETLGLPYVDVKGLRYDDPFSIKMIEVIFSEEAQTAAIKATDEGLPAMAGVDPILTRKFGGDYNVYNSATDRAGSITAEMMSARGYRKTNKKRPMPEGSVARTGEVFDLVAVKRPKSK